MNYSKKPKPNPTWVYEALRSINPFCPPTAERRIAALNARLLKRSFLGCTKTNPWMVQSKIAVALMVGTFLPVYGSTAAQTISLKHRQAALLTVLKDIEQQSSYTFMYQEADINKAPTQAVNLSNVGIDAALSTILQQSNLDFEIVDKTIILKPKSRRSAGSSLPTNHRPQAAQQQAATTLQVQVSGRVIEAGSNTGIANATVRSSSGEGTITQHDGTFSLSLKSLNSKLTISSIGYESQELQAANQMSVVMIPVEKALEEVIINTGVFQKADKSFTGSSTTVTREQLLTFGDKNLVTSLRNIDPSFNIIESNSFGSNPNRMPEIQLRGNSSIPNVNEIQSDVDVALNTPLIILDGFQTNLQKLMDINENDIETITILKDASATALYGSRGANGVIVIMTRLPQAGKLRVNLSTNWSVEDPDLSDYTLIKGRDKLALEYMAGYYDHARAENDLPLKQYYNFLLKEVNRGVETDWKAIPLRTSIGQRHNLGIEGGDAKFRYGASLQSNTIEGVMKGSSRKTTNGTITLHYNFKGLKFRNNLQIQHSKAQESPYGSFSDYTSLNAYWTPYDSNGTVTKVLGDPGNNSYSLYWNTLPANPLYNATLNTYDKSSMADIINNSSIDWSIHQDLTLRAQLGITKTNTQADRFRPANHTAFNQYDVDNTMRKGDYRFGNTNYFAYDGAVDLIFSKTINLKHQLFSAVSFNARQAENNFAQYLVEGFPNANLDYPSMGLQYAQSTKPNGNESLIRAVGFTVNSNYAFLNRYFMDATLRVDGASQFGSANRFANFWSFGLGWNLHEESFMQQWDFVDRFKLRGSIGTTGSQNFRAYQAMTTYRYHTDERYFNWIGAAPIGLGNEDLKWQNTLKKNIGVDIDLLQRRLQLKADVYVETTHDLVSSVNLAASNGFDNYTANIGKMRNSGYELTLTGLIFQNPQGFSWNLSTALVHNANKVIETSQALKDAQGAIQNGTTDPGTMYVEGYSSRTIWVVPSLGIDPSTGKELYLTKNGDPTYTWNAQDVSAVGSLEPDFFGNINSTLRYKNMALTASFRYEFGGQSYNTTLRDKVETTSYKYNVDQRVFDSRWMKPGDNAAFKGILVTSPTYKTSRFVQDNNTLILSNLQFQYQLHREAWIKKIGLESLVFAANASDPMHLSTIRRERGTVYPFAKRYSFSLRATF